MRSVGWEEGLVTNQRAKEGVCSLISTKFIIIVTFNKLNHHWVYSYWMWGWGTFHYYYCMPTVVGFGSIWRERSTIRNSFWILVRFFNLFILFYGHHKLQKHHTLNSLPQIRASFNCLCMDQNSTPQLLSIFPS